MRGPCELIGLHDFDVIGGGVFTSFGLEFGGKPDVKGRLGGFMLLVEDGYVMC